MKREEYVDREFPMMPEDNGLPGPEHGNPPPEHTPEYPDVQYFREHSVTLKEETVFHGEIPDSEKSPEQLRLEERREKEKKIRNSFWRNFIKSAMQGGAAVLAVVAIALSAAAYTAPEEAEDLPLVKNIREHILVKKKPAVSVQTGYSPEAFAALWNNEFDAPHDFDYEHVHVLQAGSCTVDGLAEVSCLKCGGAWQIPSPAQGHIGDPVVREKEIAPTCTEAGSHEEVTYCRVCREELSRVKVTDPALGHKETEPAKENVVLPNCTEPGSHEAVIFCSVCKEELSRVTVEDPALGHTEGEPLEENRIEPDCVNEGSVEQIFICQVCGEEIRRETVVLEALGHTEAEPVEENRTEPGCVTEGFWEQVIYCSVCEEELSRETVVLEALGHTEGETVDENLVKAGCFTDGSVDKVIYCSVCEEELHRHSEVLVAVGHQAAAPVMENHIAPTCTEGSYDEVIYCELCGEELSRESKTLARAAHDARNPVQQNPVKPTCTEEGSYDSVTFCRVCSTELERETVKVPALGHVEDEGTTVVTKEATCTAEGTSVTTVKCRVCGEVLKTTTNRIPVKAHTPVTDPAVAPTCTASGLTQGSHCSVCNTVITRQTVVAAKGHTAVADAAVAATCTTAGKTAGSHCSVCGTVLTAQTTVPATGHTAVTSRTVTNPTCTAQGYTTVTETCSVCRQTLSSNRVNYTAALGHSFTTTTMGEAAWRPADMTQSKCTRCGTAGITASYSSTTGMVSFSIRPELASQMQEAGYNVYLSVGRFVKESDGWSSFGGDEYSSTSGSFNAMEADFPENSQVCLVLIGGNAAQGSMVAVSNIFTVTTFPEMTDP